MRHCADALAMMDTEWIATPSTTARQRITSVFSECERTKKIRASFEIWGSPQAGKKIPITIPARMAEGHGTATDGDAPSWSEDSYVFA